MKLKFFLSILIKMNMIISFQNNFSNKKKNIIKLLNGVYKITSLANNYNFNIKNNLLILLSEHSNFRLIHIQFNEYYLESIYRNQKVGINDKYHIKIYDKIIKNNEKFIWKIININKNEFLIQNRYNLKFLESISYKLICRNTINFVNRNSQINQNFKFKFLKLYDEGSQNKKDLENINKEPIDIVIKYIDLTDKQLKRIGINQFYKDFDNEELKYSLRSIFKYVPWIRKIFIVMPNEKVKYLKSIEEINYKIIYIKDKDLLGFDSANIFSFTFNLYKLQKFGISNNFIYMEDDFFIGKQLKKNDFFYYDKKDKKIYPYILTKYFNELNESEVIDNYNQLLKFKDSIFPHSRWGWRLSIYNTDIYFMERYKIPLINTLFTHNAIAENIDDLKEMFEEISFYKYINETLYSKERHILTLNQPHFFNLYQLNIKQKKVHSIPYRYIEMEYIKKKHLDIPLFVINTGGNHIPLIRQYKVQKKFMDKKYSIETLYEIKNRNIYKKKSNIEKIIYIILKIFIIFKMLKNNIII